MTKFLELTGVKGHMLHMRRNFTHVEAFAKMSWLNRLLGIGAGLAITGAAIKTTLYNGK